MPKIKHKAPRTRIKPLIKTQIKSLWESGLFDTLHDLHAACKDIFLSNAPGIDWIKQHASREHWDKTAYQQRLEAAQQKSFQELFDEAGLGDKETVDEIVKGVHHAEDIVKKIAELIKENKGSLSMEVLEKLKEAIDNLKIKRMYIAERNKLTGAYAAAKINLRPVNAPKGGKYSEEEITLEELEAEHERLSAALAE